MIAIDDTITIRGLGQAVLAFLTGDDQSIVRLEVAAGGKTYQVTVTETTGAADAYQLWQTGIFTERGEQMPGTDVGGFGSQAMALVAALMQIVDAAYALPAIS